MRDFNAMKSITEVKAAAREAVFTDTLEFYKSKYGEDAVTITGSNQFVVVVGTRKDALGNEREVCVEIKPTAKEVEDRKTDKNFFPAFDRFEAAEAWEADRAEKAANKAVRDATRKAKAEKDSAKRKATE